MRPFNWDSGREFTLVERIFEYTDDHIKEQFRQGGNLLLDRLMALPCLFMREETRDEISYVGRINRPRVVGRDVWFNFTLDTDVPPL